LYFLVDHNSDLTPSPGVRGATVQLPATLLEQRHE
jgi:hypothetical protein